MKLFFTSLLLVLILKVPAQERKIVSGTPGPSAQIRLRCSASVISEQPLYVVDGVPVDSFQLSGLDPNNILTINILNGTKASALFGCGARNGVIVITTKAGSERKLKIEDAIDFSAMPGATVSMIKGNDTTVLIADERGEVSYLWNASMSGMKVEVSCIGYEKTPLHLSMKKEQEVKMHRKQEEMDPVIIQGYGIRRMRCGIICRCIMIKSDTMIIKNPSTTFYIFPNPAVAGETVQIRLTDSFTGNARLYNMAGQVIATEKLDVGKCIYKRFSLPNVPAGTYLIILTDVKDRPAGKAKLILQ